MTDKKEKRVRSRWDTKRLKKRTKGKTITQQQFKDEVDVNNIVNKFDKTGVVTHLNSKTPRYGFAESVDFKEAMDTVTDASEAFEDLPANVREYFNNDPQSFLEGLNDPNHQQILSELGIKFIDPASDEETEAMNQQGSAAPEKQSSPEDG